MSDRDYDPAPLLHVMQEGLVLHQAVYAVAELGVADLLVTGPQTTEELAARLGVVESMLRRLLRLLSSQGFFAETAPGVFANNPASNCLRGDGAISLRALARFRGSPFVYESFAEILHTLQTGETGRSKALGMDGWAYLESHPDMSRIFDDAMTSSSSLAAPAIAAAYDFSRWERIMDVGGGNGILLAAILRAHPTMHGVLADRAHVIERARHRGFLSGDLEGRSTMQVCDLFENIPSGCRACLMKSVIHDWNDDDALRILRNCRNAVPTGGALFLVEIDLPEDDRPSRGKFADVSMMVLTGGRERTSAEYGALLDSAGFHLTRTIPTSSGFNILEALPA